MAVTGVVGHDRPPRHPPSSITTFSLVAGGGATDLPAVAEDRPDRVDARDSSCFSS